MAKDAGAHFIMPVHHQTFRLSFEEFREPIERFEAARRNAPERIALRKIVETFVLPQIRSLAACPLASLSHRDTIQA